MDPNEANKYMLLGVEFTLKILGVDKDGLLGRFVQQEFQSWVQSIESPTRGIVGSRAKPPEKGKAA